MDGWPEDDSQLRHWLQIKYEKGKWKEGASVQKGRQKLKEKEGSRRLKSLLKRFSLCISRFLLKSSELTLKRTFHLRADYKYHWNSFHRWNACRLFRENISSLMLSWCCLRPCILLASKWLLEFVTNYLSRNAIIIGVRNWRAHTVIIRFHCDYCRASRGVVAVKDFFRSSTAEVK